MMDESKEGLLSPSQRYHHPSSYDAEAGVGHDADEKFARTRRSISSDMDDSDLDATEFLTADPLANPVHDRTPAFLGGQRAGISLSTLRRPFRGRSKCCITTCVLILIIWLMLGAGGAFVYVCPHPTSQD